MKAFYFVLYAVLTLTPVVYVGNVFINLLGPIGYIPAGLCLVLVGASFAVAYLEQRAAAS